LAAVEAQGQSATAPGCSAGEQAGIQIKIGESGTGSGRFETIIRVKSRAAEMGLLVAAIVRHWLRAREAQYFVPIHCVGKSFGWLPAVGCVAGRAPRLSSKCDGSAVDTGETVSDPAALGAPATPLKP